MANSITISGVHAGYGSVRVLEDVSLDVRPAETVVLLGTNGNGKSTLMKCIMGMVRPSAGTIVAEIDGKTHDLVGRTTEEIVDLGIALVPEGRRLFPNLTVTENLQLASRARGFSLEQVFELFPRLQTRQKAKAENLSGGERQMVAIARALMVPSRLILLDEPFEGLAPAIVQEVMDALVPLRGRAAMIIVEHHAETVLPIADRAYVLVNGQVAYEGSATALEADAALQSRLLGLVQQELTAAD